MFTVVVKPSGYHSFCQGIVPPDFLKEKLRHAAGTEEPFAEFDRLYTLKNKHPRPL
jgi:hypothetical protein